MPCKLGLTDFQQHSCSNNFPIEFIELFSYESFPSGDSYIVMSLTYQDGSLVIGGNLLKILQNKITTIDYISSKFFNIHPNALDHKGNLIIK